MPSVLQIIPMNAVSWITGCLARVRPPRPLAKPLLQCFVSGFGINLQEAEKPLQSYKSIEDVFTRKLRQGARPIAERLASPADGMIERGGPADGAAAIQAKGLEYSLKELLYGQDHGGIGDQELAFFQTIYLAPHNYHRVHAPFAGAVERIRYIPGELWPVNRTYVPKVPRLFCRNERLVFDFRHPQGARTWVVMVGAFNVGRMVTPLAPQLVTNSMRRQVQPKVVVEEFSPARAVGIGEELGTFMLGSTVIVVYDKLMTAELKPQAVTEPRAVLMGQNLSEQS